MTVNSVQVYEYRCDRLGCKSVHEQKNASGHYWESLPPSWTSVSLIISPQKNFRNMLLCSNCSHGIEELHDRLTGKSP